MNRIADALLKGVSALLRGVVHVRGVSTVDKGVHLRGVPARLRAVM